MSRVRFLLLLIFLLLTIFGLVWYVGRGEQATVEVPPSGAGRARISPADSIATPEVSPRKKKSIQEREREMRAEMAEFQNEGAKILSRLEAALPMSLTDMAKTVVARRKPEYEVLFQEWQLTPDQIAEVWGVIEEREQTTTPLLHESITAGRSTPKGIELVEKMRAAQSNASTDLETILGAGRAQQLADWEKEQFGTIKKRLRD